MTDLSGFRVEDGVLRGDIGHDFEGGVALTFLAAKMVLQEALGEERAGELSSLIIDRVEMEYSKAVDRSEAAAE